MVADLEGLASTSKPRPAAPAIKINPSLDNGLGEQE
jgi:hypothetical protein